MFSSRNLSSAACSLADMGYILMLNWAGVSSVSLILWLCGLDGGNFFASSSKNNAVWHLNCSGSVTSHFACDLAYS